MHRFFVTSEGFSENTVTLKGSDVNHIRAVLRMKPGDRIEVIDHQGLQYEVVLAEVERDHVRGEILSRIEMETESPVNIRMGQALIKGNAFDLLVRKATELGVHSIGALRTQRCVARWRKSLKRTAHNAGNASPTKPPSNADDPAYLRSTHRFVIKGVLSAIGRLRFETGFLGRRTTNPPAGHCFAGLGDFHRFSCRTGRGLGRGGDRLSNPTRISNGVPGPPSSESRFGFAGHPVPAPAPLGRFIKGLAC